MTAESIEPLAAPRRSVVRSAAPSDGDALVRGALQVLRGGAGWISASVGSVTNHGPQALAPGTLLLVMRARDGASFRMTEWEQGSWAALKVDSAALRFVYTDAVPVGTGLSLGGLETVLQGNPASGVVEATLSCHGVPIATRTLSW